MLQPTITTGGLACPLTRAVTRAESPMRAGGWRAGDCARHGLRKELPGTRNSPEPPCAVGNAGSLPTRGRKAPYVGSLRGCLADPAGNPVKLQQRLLLAARVDVADGGAMTQLARPDPARSRSGRDDARPGPASATSELLPANRSGLVRAGRPVPGWAVGTALLAPVVLVSGWLVAGALQPASYARCGRR